MYEYLIAASGPLGYIKRDLATSRFMNGLEEIARLFRSISALNSKLAFTYLSRILTQTRNFVQLAT